MIGFWTYGTESVLYLLIRKTYYVSYSPTVLKWFFTFSIDFYMLYFWLYDTKSVLYSPYINHTYRSPRY